MQNNHKKAGEQLMRFLLDEAKKKGLTTHAIADKSGFDQPHVWRMLNAKYLPNLENFLKLAEAVGVRLELHSESPAPDFAAIRNVDTPRFLFAPDQSGKQLYILHTHTPACLIKVVQKTPVQLVVVENYEPISDDLADLIQDAYTFFIENASNKS